MKIFHCDNCQQLVFFENTHCLNCSCTLAYLADIGEMVSLEAAGENIWRSRKPAAQSRQYKLCGNYKQQNVCNWAMSVESGESLCRSCRLTRVIPDLNQEGNRQRWAKLESAKRRLVYTLMQLQCPLASATENPEQGLAFEFLSDAGENSGKPVLTGHADGVITLNVAEADDAERERRRVELHEPYRTLLGHFRHEVGHYYWDRLVAGTPRLQQYRALFGDERNDYSAALQTHYQQGPSPDWQQNFISAYAAAHPWEDWAETWAHYLHMIDTLETAQACGLSLEPERRDEPQLDSNAANAGGNATIRPLIDAWFPLTYVLNNLNRGLGLADAYPFVLSTPVIEKLHFIHETVHGEN